MKRWNIVLLVTLVVQLVLLVGTNLPTGASEDAVTGPLLTDFTAADVDHLTITDNNDAVIELAKVDGEWVLPNADNYPARSENVQALLDKVAALQANRLIAQNPTSQARLEVKSDKFQRRLDFGEGDKTETLYVGTSAGSNATHMRVDGDNRIFLTDMAAWEVRTTLASWINTTYFSTTRANIVQFSVENENGTFDFVKTGDQWTYNGLNEGETFDPESITSLLNSISSVRMTEPIGKEYTMDPVLATVTMTVEETVEPDTSAEATPEATPEVTAPQTVSHTYTLRLGPTFEDTEDHVVKSSESEYYVRVGTTFSNNLLNLTHDGLLLVPDNTTEGDASAGS